ncbi:PREDICTED: probable disease resistance RPP8-like protein 4 [Erythranthe guttata]|uniref:probable disease resistance RPP8-like protein 4 n=1 Tax=Erythranthe guttata TaxID=4155 RepID=UPI00064E02C8|nr:PREDICTED: probable disease resistance RPP8-like protein 4 [Erythranthe guttata]|eukprot:XP_012831573.1 PREDICTED: probable disease resistance RPP8-like protein 4 [Erythranthe guttata]
MGGLLKKHGQSKDEWTKVLKGMNSHLKTGESSVSHIMELSYHDLPPQLKSCFLCLGFFKEDATIRAEKLIQVWIAQGLIPPKEDKDETMEEIARDYLDELINRNMIQVKDTTKDDRVKNCLIHDFLHDLAITKAKEEIRLEILRDEGGGSQSSQKSRHRVIYCGTETPVFSSQKNNHIRSLFFHGHGNNIFGGSTVWKNFQLLRVLDFENAGLEFLPDAIGEIVGLRYLGLRNNDIKELPSSFSRLKNLQVLDISLNFSMEVPNIIWKMISLRHLYMSRITCQASPKVDYLKNLQTLTYIPTPRWTREHTTRMTSLRKLGLELDEKSDIINLFDSLAMLANLLCLNLRWYGNHDILFEDGLRKLPCLTQLKLQGKMTELPTVGNFPPNLSHLSLIHTALDKDPMPVLEKLPKLVYLKLDGAFTGEQMTITRDGLPKLNVLSLRELIKLRKIRVGARGMSDLRRLEIHRCPHLDNLPGELEFMEQLGELKMVTTEEIVSKLRYNHSRIFSRIPSLHLVSVTLKD